MRPQAVRAFLVLLALVAASWAVALGLLWVAVFVSPWIPLGIIAVVLLIAIEPKGLVRR
jgi:hypothetical protein